MAHIFHRNDLSEAFTEKLLRPSFLDAGYQSGLFLSGPRRIGKTTFIRQDLIPSLQEAGALVLYADLWAEPSVDPAKLLNRAISKALTNMQSRGQKLAKHLNSAELSLPGLRVSFDPHSLGQDQDIHLPDVFKELIAVSQCNVVLIIDEVQHALSTEAGRNMLFSLKATRDAINLDPDSEGRFLLVGTGSHRAQVSELVTRRNHAFMGAVSMPFPPLGDEYVDFLLDTLKCEVPELPPISRAIAINAFETLGRKPEEMMSALSNVLTAWGLHRKKPDDTLEVIADTLRSQFINLELHKLDALGQLSTSIFKRVASAPSEVKGFFSSDTIESFSNELGREVSVEEVQQALNALLDENLLMRVGHGTYDVVDPFIRENWTDAGHVFGISERSDEDPLRVHHDEQQSGPLPD
jgi:hypothetical protein